MQRMRLRLQGSAAWRRRLLILSQAFCGERLQLLDMCCSYLEHLLPVLHCRLLHADGLGSICELVRLFHRFGMQSLDARLSLGHRELSRPQPSLAFFGRLLSATYGRFASGHSRLAPGCARHSLRRLGLRRLHFLELALEQLLVFEAKGFKLPGQSLVERPCGRHCLGMQPMPRVL